MNVSLRRQVARRTGRMMSATTSESKVRIEERERERERAIAREPDSENVKLPQFSIDRAVT